MKHILTYIVLIAWAIPAFSQQIDPAKLNGVLEAQRNNASNAVAQCSVVASEQQARIAELEKQIADLKAAAEPK